MIGHAAGIPGNKPIPLLDLDLEMASGNLELIMTNAAWLRQAVELLQRLDDVTFQSSPHGLEPHRAGSHFRHVLEFYECFLDGLASRKIDYDARKRNEAIEKSRLA